MYQLSSLLKHYMKWHLLLQQHLMQNLPFLAVSACSDLVNFSIPARHSALQSQIINFFLLYHSLPFTSYPEMSDGITEMDITQLTDYMPEDIDEINDINVEQLLANHQFVMWKYCVDKTISGVSVIGWCSDDVADSDLLVLVTQFVAEEPEEVMAWDEVQAFCINHIYNNHIVYIFTLGLWLWSSLNIIAFRTIP